MNTLPFKQEIIDNKRIRTFSQNTDSDELKWHRDRENREVKIIENEDWFLQMDNELPQKLIVGEKYYIPTGVYHRVIKGKGNLVVEITFV
jgi:hypothetical protein